MYIWWARLELMSPLPRDISHRFYVNHLKGIGTHICVSYVCIHIYVSHIRAPESYTWKPYTAVYDHMSADIGSLSLTIYGYHMSVIICLSSYHMFEIICLQSYTCNHIPVVIYLYSYMCNCRTHICALFIYHICVFV